MASPSDLRDFLFTTTKEIRKAIKAAGDIKGFTMADDDARAIREWMTRQSEKKEGKKPRNPSIANRSLDEM